jgi:hypothetical protein
LKEEPKGRIIRKERDYDALKERERESERGRAREKISKKVVRSECR